MEQGPAHSLSELFRFARDRNFLKSLALAVSIRSCIK